MSATTRSASLATPSLRSEATRAWPRCAAVLLCTLALAVLPLTTRAADEPVNAGPYVPTPQYIVDRMLQMAAVSAKDFVIDLGAGDGRIVTTAARYYGARGLGVDIDQRLVDLSITNAHKAGVADRARFVQQDAFKTDLSPATVLTLYLLPKFVLDLRPKMLNELKPGTRIVSHDYNLGEWEADNWVTFDSPEKEVINGSAHTSLFYYVVPARVAGTWRLNLPEGLPERSVDVSLRQRYQRVAGSVNEGSSKAGPLSSARLRGDTLQLELVLGAGTYQLEGKVNGDRIAGTMLTPDKRKLAFSAVRTAQGEAIGWK